VNEGTRGLALFLGLLALLFTVAANSLIGTCQEKTLFDWSIQIRRHPNTEHSSPVVYPHHDSIGYENESNNIMQHGNKIRSRTNLIPGGALFQIEEIVYIVKVKWTIYKSYVLVHT
jgi:hypothetical protein